MTAGMATSSPIAVVTSASAIPPATAAKPAIAEGPGHCRGKGARLLASRVICHGTVNHDPDRPARHDEQNDDHGLRHQTHRFPQAERVGWHAALLENPGGNRGYMSEHN